MARNDLLGKPVIDELRLCYIAEPSLLADLQSIPFGECWTVAEFALFRIAGDRFEFMYSVCIGEHGNRVEIGTMKFGRFGVEAEQQFVYYKIANHVLYNEYLMKIAMSLPEIIELSFNNFTAIDIAIDYTKGISNIIKRMLRDEKIITILNGKAIRERKRTIHGITIDYSTSLDRLKYPTITIKQAKAYKSKTKGVIIQSYDKKAEILNSSEKNYILEYYGAPRWLYRLEVRLHYQEIKDYCSNRGIYQAAELIYDNKFLEDLFYYHLGSVLRFTKGRKPIPWKDVIECAGKV